VKREAEDAIDLAGWLSFKKRGEQNLKLEALSNEALSKASDDTLNRAQTMSKNYAGLFPKVTLTEIRWPEETKITWYKILGSDAPSLQIWVIGIRFVPVQEVDGLPSYSKHMRSL